MRFINPKIRFAFTKIFGYAENTDILKSFLNALVWEEQPIIESLEIITPEAGFQIFGSTNSYLNVIAELNNGTSVIIAVQVLYVSALAKLVLYDAGKIYGTQLMLDRLHKGMQPVIYLSFADFPMFDKDRDIISRFTFKEKTHRFDYPYSAIELIFVELPKFNKKLEELQTITDKWIYFMKNSSSLHKIPAQLSAVPEIHQAFEIANAVNLTFEECDTLREQEYYVYSHQTLVEYHREKAREEAREEARQEARLKGIKQGKVEVIWSWFNRLLGQLNPDIESQINELSIEQLDNLGEAVLDFSNVEDLTAWLQANSQ
jgi:predicted transposase/invertase (TIGR01784 family)